jgi:hypothetical protein
MSKKVEFKFELGKPVITPGAFDAIMKSNAEPAEFLHRHGTGDWGIAGKEDWEWNDQAVINGTRIFSVYTLDDDSVIWVITEASRETTTILLPDEY